MSGITLRLRGAPAFRVDLSGIVPSRIGGLSIGEVERIGIGTESGPAVLGDLFSVSGTAGDTVTIEDSSNRIDFAGAGLDSGAVVVRGDAGAYAGAGMRGGRLEIVGNAGSYLGAGLKGGLVAVKGSAGDYLGGARAGERFGMTGGTVVVGGNAGTRAGERMRRGTVIVRGKFGPAAGSRMVGGTLWTEGGFGAGAGPLLRRGTLIGPSVEHPLPTFADCGRHDLVILRILNRQMTELLGPWAPKPLPATVRRLAGDLATIGKGEILLTA